ncbi:hypothetical protein MUP77_04075 [Candidatus Bathyarchaeota archaeon]|nr:hypothetical protein [Candidatus Bathyarchaeota archaeon]
MQRKKMLIAVLAIALLVGGVSAAVIQWFGQVKMTATVNQAVLVDGYGYPYVIAETANVAGGESFCRYHWLTSQTSVPVALKFYTDYDPLLVGAEITTTYTSTITESSSYADYYDDKRIMVLKNIGDMTVSEFLGVPLEYTVNVISNPLYAPNICFWMTNGTHTYVVEAWGKDWTGTGWHTVTIQDFFSGTMGYEVTVDTTYGQLNRISPVQPGTYLPSATAFDEFKAYYGSWTVLSAQVRAQAGAAGGQVLRPVQFKAAGETIDIPDLDVFDALTLQPGEVLPFYICYKFDLLIEAGTYDIYTTIKPV